MLTMGVHLGAHMGRRFIMLTMRRYRRCRHDSMEIGKGDGMSQECSRSESEHREWSSNRKYVNLRSGTLTFCEERANSEGYPHRVPKGY